MFAIWRSSRVYLPPARRFAALGLRAAVVSLVVVALAGPLVQLRASTLAVAVLLDRSDSISPAAQDQQEQWLSPMLASKAPDDQVAVITFAGDASVERPLSTDRDTAALADADGPASGDRTDIAAAIRTGLAALPPSTARRLVLLSDGRRTRSTPTRPPRWPPPPACSS